MLNKKVVLGVLVLLIVGLSQCGDDDGGTPQINCSSFCQKNQSCNFEEPEGISCQDQCGCFNSLVKKGFMQEIFINQTNECYNRSECSEIESCLSDVLINCTTPNVRSWAETYCKKLEDCGINEDDNCITYLDEKVHEELLRCFTSNMFDLYTNCITLASKCDSLEEDIFNCISESLKNQVGDQCARFTIAILNK